MLEMPLSKKANLCGHQNVAAISLKMLAPPPVIGEPIFGHTEQTVGRTLDWSPWGQPAAIHNLLIRSLFAAPLTLVTTFYTYPQVTRS